MQTFTFYASEDKLSNRGHTAGNIGVIRKKILKLWTKTIHESICPRFLRAIVNSTSLIIKLGLDKKARKNR